MPFQPLLPFEEPDESPPPLESSRLIEELARVCREKPLDEKILVAPSLAIGHQITQRLARRVPWINLRVETARTLASQIAGPALAREGSKLLSRAQALALVEQACLDVLPENGYFASLRDRPGLHRALHETLDELRAAGFNARMLPAGAFADRRKHRELQEVLSRYEEELRSAKLVDGIALLSRAHEELGPAVGASETIYLLARDTDLSALERAFLLRLAGGSLVGLETDPAESWTKMAANCRLVRALGEENEIREVFRRILEEGIPFGDVEILHADASVYPALVWELSCEHAVACTFGGGIAASYTRPGRAALFFLDWIAQGFAADVLRRALVSGALTLSGLSSEEGGRSHTAARALREAGIGWGRDRHARRLDRLVAELETNEEGSHVQAERGEAEIAERDLGRQRRLAAALQARLFVRRALELAPASLDAPGDLRALAAGARGFVREFARIADDLDAAARTALEALFSELEELIPLRLTGAAAVSRLSDAVSGLSISADRPRPGRVHVAHYRAGGFSGRPRTFLVGLDETRVPGPDLEDPVLLDDERRRINTELPQPVLALNRERPREAALALRVCVARLRGEMTASYSSFDLRNLSQAGEPAPSPFLLEIFRERSGRERADYQDLAAELGRACGFAPASPASALDDSEWWLSLLRGSGAGTALAPAVRTLYPWLEDGHRAEQARASREFTAWDGWVRGGTPELDPRSEGAPFSPSRIQDLARCPFAYFVRHVLHVAPPRDLERDPTRWLDPMSEGSLLHEVFKEFFERITQAGEKPRSAEHLELILDLADERIQAWRERVAPPGELAFNAQRETIRFACRTLLRLEEEHCRDVTPRFYEVPFGLARNAKRSPSPGRALPAAPGLPESVASPEPVEIEVGAGRVFRLRGSIDRVDQGADGTFHVWDYKTGGAWNVREGGGLRGGRQIQPALYALAFEALLERAGAAGRVSRTGYFFPGRKGEGLRVSAPPDVEETRRVLSRLFDLVGAGLFPHALAEEDCKFCDFESICGGVRQASERAREKLALTTDPILKAFGRMHAGEED